MTTKRKRRKFWSRSFGPYLCRVRVYERSQGVIHAEVRTAHGHTRKSLKHRYRERAEQWAKQEQAGLALGVKVIESPAPTVARVFREYKLNVTPKKKPAGQKNDKRADAMWTRVLGESKDLSKLTRAEWERFTDARRSGRPG